MKIHFLSSNSAKSKIAYRFFKKLYGQVDINDADVIVSLSGDGMVLRAFHENFDKKIPIYGMNRGKMGFLTNEFRKDDLIERLEKAERLDINPLIMNAIAVDGNELTSIAINEVYIFRETHQTAKLKIEIDNVVKMEELVCDGVILSSPIGSTAYNFSAGGPILPFDCDLLSLATISAFRPRRWRGAIIKNTSKIKFSVIDAKTRPVRTVSDYLEFKKIEQVEVFQDIQQTITLLIDNKITFREKMINEQFS